MRIQILILGLKGLADTSAHKKVLEDMGSQQ